MSKIILPAELAENQIKITMYLKPVIYDSASVLGSVFFDKNKHRYHTDVNPARQINGPLSGPGEELEPPIREELNNFIEDCRFLLKELKFTIISQHTSEDSKKSEYFIVFGMNDEPCGTLVYDLRVSDHPLDATFPEESKDEVLEYLKMNNILDGSASKAGIDFVVEKVTIGSVNEDSWDKAFNRLFNTLKSMRNKIRARLKSRN